MDAILQVAVGVIRDRQGRILITQRAQHVHQGGLWEFPGGKLEAGESVEQALRRELYEEVGIQVQAAQPLIKVRHDYGDRQVLLDVWDVSAYAGTAVALEGQDMDWVLPQNLSEFCFPAANLPIVKTLQLPTFYPILEGQTSTEILDNADWILQSGFKLIQLRAKSLREADLPKVFAPVWRACRQHQAILLVNADLQIEGAVADGIHLSSRKLMAIQQKPPGYAWIAASCHNLQELQHAEQLGVDFAVLAPVRQTATHPQSQPLGWETFQALRRQVSLPVFALGGLGLADMETAREFGAHGLAGISAFLR